MMSKVLQATYQDGSLVLDEKLDSTLQGHKITLILVEDSAGNHQTEIDLEERKRRFIEQLRTYSIKVPEDYKFNREEIHDRECFHRF